MATTVGVSGRLLVKRTRSTTALSPGSNKYGTAIPTELPEGGSLEEELMVTAVTHGALGGRVKGTSEGPSP
jgi:hypothetical protein